ncbi:MAG: MFS transporter [Candidatus Dormibacteraeota bacterium]|nr:MFS transporter [Candidatus Dormibacteraeota bacterium]
MARATAGRLHYAWIVAAVTFVTLLAAAGTRATPGVLIVPLQHEYGWNRAEISGAVSINLILFGLIGPFAAAFMARFGIRRVVVGALITIATGVTLTTAMTGLWQLYLLWGVVVGIGAGCMASVLAAVVANRWFVARRGLVVGVLTAAGATGQLVFLPVLASEAVTAGWRWASLTVAGAILLVIPLVAFLLRDKPADVGLRALGATEADAPGVTGNPVSAALDGLRLGLRSSAFWLLAGSFFICGATTNGLIGTHLIPASIDHGIAEVTAASLLAVIGIFDIVGTVCSGWLTDRFDSRWLLFWYYGLRGLALLLLPFVLGSSFFGLILFIVFYGLDWVATVPPTVALATTVFGKQKGAVVFGWIFAFHQFGAAAAAFAAGALRTWLGDYQVTFISAGLLCLIACGLVIRINRAPAEVARPPALADAPAAY